jgi:hypothetical protein
MKEWWTVIYSFYRAMDYKKVLSRRLTPDDAAMVCYHTQGKAQDKEKEKLFQLLFDEDKRVADNAAYVFTYFAFRDRQWLLPRRNELARETMMTRSETKQRLLLKVLCELKWEETDFDNELLDFCFQKILSEKTSVAVRVWAMKLAFEQCRFYPELLRELQQTLESVDASMLTSGARTARRNVMSAIGKLLS